MLIVFKSKMRWADDKSAMPYLYYENLITLIDDSCQLKIVCFRHSSAWVAKSNFLSCKVFHLRAKEYLTVCLSDLKAA